MSNLILVVDDKSSVRQLLRDYLTKQEFRVVVAENGQEALYVARHELPDLILLDIMMPKMDGFDFLRQYRQEKRTPVIIITAREEEADAVLGLELGADDYIIKPFRMREMIVRIRAVLRRVDGADEPAEQLHVGDITLDQTAHQVMVRNQQIALTPIEFNLLAILMRSPGQVFTRTQLVDHLIDSGFTGLEQTLNVHIRNLRKKIEYEADIPAYIETVFGVGYRFKRA
jgi:DNA-binding response OmpR family regulator